MANRNTVRYSVLGVWAGPTPSTGYQFLTGFNNVYTGANSGQNQIQGLQRIQTVSDGLTVDRQLVNQLGQLEYLDQVILSQPQIPVQLSWIQADVTNEYKLGLYVSGNQSALTNVLSNTAAERNLFIGVAPEGQNAVDYTGQMQVFQLNNCYFGSYSAEASVGGFATASASLQGLNFSTSTGSINQDLNAVDVTNGNIVPGIKYTLPTLTTGTAGSTSALRFGDIVVDTLSGIQGLVASDLKLQSYNLSFDTNLQDLLKLGSRFSYTRVAQFPILLNCSVTANYGDIQTGTLSNLLCNDPLYNMRISLYQPGCGASGPLAARYDIRGVKLQSQDFGAQDVGSNTATVTLNFQGSIGGPTSQTVNLFITGYTGP